MCEISTIAEDWIKKGCHVRVNAIELRVCPDHTGYDVVLRSVFAGEPVKALAAAKKKFRRHLKSRKNCKRLFREVQRARKFLSQSTGGLRQVALDRAGELTFLMHVFKRMSR